MDIPRIKARFPSNPVFCRSYNSRSEKCKIFCILPRKKWNPKRVLTFSCSWIECYVTWYGWWTHCHRQASISLRSRRRMSRTTSCALPNNASIGETESLVHIEIDTSPAESSFSQSCRQLACLGRAIALWSPGLAEKSANQTVVRAREGRWILTWNYDRERKEKQWLTENCRIQHSLDECCTSCQYLVSCFQDPVLKLFLLNTDGVNELPE